MSYNTVNYSVAQAFDPAASVFVSANAGAGKTSLLTNRVLALLLHGVPPSKLLCLTFTNAAAAEMANRVLEKLGGWVMADDTQLALQLAALTGKPADKNSMIRARGLFAKVLEAPEGIRIQTIHGFCQSLLRRFPIEAGISPHFTVMDARTEQELLKEARLRLFSRAQNEDPELQASLNAMAHALSESSFNELLAEIVKNKRRIMALFSSTDGVETAITTIWKLLKVPRGSTEDKLVTKYFSYDEATLKQLRHICGFLLNGSITDQRTGGGLAGWLEKQPGNHKAIAAYINIMLTKEGERRARKGFFTKDILSSSSDIDLLLAEQERVWNFCLENRALETAQRSVQIIRMAEALLALYDKLKNSHALMDYDDLILTACDLLHKPGIAPWVLYKLDGGIDHILVDEAQDTSPQQWQIINALTQEFFAGKSSREQERSLFVVGDEKQSIYSFQGADPTALGRKELDFSVRIRDASKLVHKIELVHSFRSTREILAAVDSIFSRDEARAGLMFGDGDLTHIPTRLTHPGIVELWPLVSALEQDGEVTVSSGTRLAGRIADTIRGWLDSGIFLESKGRAVEAGDIMILVRKRTSLVDRLVRALKRRNIQVAGHDRMALGDNLAVQDMIALGQCLLLPQDDLTLAALLKSPIFNIGEESLFQLAWQRGGKNLWERLRENAGKDTACASAYALLSDLRGRADFVSPFELYSYMLECCGGRKRFIGRMGEEYNDAIDEFLGQALLYERSHISSLQGFLHWLHASDSEIKRDMEQARNCIRIMTVHGAKGLQAPIVILPDTVDLPTPRDTLLWYEGEEGNYPFWPLSSRQSDPLSAELRNKHKEAAHAEYRRLLYVALTRAEDRLYIGGAAPRNTINDQSWYRMAENGLKELATAFEMEEGQGLRVGIAPRCHPERGEGSPAINGDPSVISLPQDDTDFSFLNRRVPSDPMPPQPLVPSRMPDDEPALASPFGKSDSSVFQRGNVIHRLLQYLPGVSAEERKHVAGTIASSYRKSLPDAVLHECVAQVLRVIENPEFAFLFSPESLAEVPVAGCVMLAGTPVAVAGQVDRLHIGKEEVWIIDFKSNRLPPQDVRSVPSAYVKQMMLYKVLLKNIYPDKIIRCALLWTADASLTILDELLLDEGALSSYI